jgi:hypothetical protein
MPSEFDPTTLELLRTTREVEIETSRTPTSPRHRTIIWVVVDTKDRALVRTYRGAGSRWYREVLGGSASRLHVGSQVLEVRVVPAADDDRIAAYNEEVVRKYAGSSSTPFMLVDDVLPTTLELLPR